eukprot:NODE_197_length_15379_cov_0.485602.p5 type:complete len:395 gc:universal NODE_197_length_15379_cov_0.485602:2843-1659(-)
MFFHTMSHNQLENLQPRKFGRLNNSDIVDLDAIKLDNFESAYQSIMQAYKVNPDQKPIIQVIRNLIKLNKENTSMRNDSRYFNLYLIIIESYTKKLDLYKELQNCQLFNKLSEFYKQYALELQKNQLYEESKQILTTGVKETDSTELQSMLNSISTTPQMNTLNPSKRIKISSDHSNNINTNIFEVNLENIQKGVPLKGQIIPQPKRIAEQYVIPQQNDHYSILLKEMNDPNLVRKYDFNSLHPVSFDYTSSAHRATMRTFEQVKYDLFIQGMHKNVTTRRISKTPAAKETPPEVKPVARKTSFDTPIPQKFESEPTMTFHTRQAMNDVNKMFKIRNESTPVELLEINEEEYTKQLYANPSTLFSKERKDVKEDLELDLDDSFMEKIKEMENKL